MEFYETDELNGNFDNWNGPTVGCVLAMCRAAGFARVELIAVDSDNAVVACFRKWPAEPEEPAQEAPELGTVVNAANLGINFHSRRDHDIDCWFRAGGAIPRKEELLLEVGEFGGGAILVAPNSGACWAKFSLPPGLKPGWNDVRLRLADSRFSAAQRIAVDIPTAVERIVIAGVRDSVHWEADTVNVSESGYLSCWVEGLPENADRGNVRFRLGDSAMEVTFVGQALGGRHQINAKAPQNCAKGELPLRVECAGVSSKPVTVKVI
jgi:hypothetical protein